MFYVVWSQPETPTFSLGSFQNEKPQVGPILGPSGGGWDALGATWQLTEDDRGQIEGGPKVQNF